MDYRVLFVSIAVVIMTLGGAWAGRSVWLATRVDPDLRAIQQQRDAMAVYMEANERLAITTKNGKVGE